MAFTDRLQEAVKVLLGVSAYESPPPGTELPLEHVKRVRRAIGGQIQPLPSPRLRWYMEHLESAQFQADNGNIAPAAQLCRAMNRDGVFKGLLNQRTKGLIRLEKKYMGNEQVCSVLRAENGTRSVFDEMCPPSELALLVGDGIKLGIGI